MRMNLVVLFGMGAVLAGCAHSSEVSSSSSTSEVVADTGKTTPDPVVATTGGYPLDLKGVALLGASGTTAPATISGQVKSTDTSVIVSNGNPITLAYTGDGPLHGTVVKTARADAGDADTVRFLMSDQSINSKDAPTAFGVLVNKSTATEFAAGGLYGGKAATNIPQSGVATYTGVYAGVTNQYGQAKSETLDLNLKADFGNGKVDGTMASRAEDGNNLEFTASMSADKAAYSGDSVSIVNDFAATPNIVLNGQVEGGFYNEGASETAGALAASNADKSISIVGAFHGDKQP